jgi:hypothetical protein
VRLVLRRRDDDEDGPDADEAIAVRRN